MSSDMEFEGAGDVNLGLAPISAGSIKKGMYVMLKNKPCKVVDYSTAKVGKHGSAKAKIIGTCIFTDVKCEEICPTSHNMLAPTVKRTTLQMIAINEDGYATLLSEDGSLKEDCKAPDIPALAEAVNAGKEVEVVVISAVGQEMIAEHRIKD